jgi:flagellar hook-associated protein 2
MATSSGSISSLGIGSGTLTYDVIEQLKESDEAAIIDPIETKITDTEEKMSELSSLITTISLLKSSVNDLSNGTLMSERLTSVTGSSVTATAEDGVEEQSIKIDVEQLAQNDIYQSTGFATEESTINSTGSDQEIKFNINGIETSLTIEAGASLSDLKSAINEADIGVTASIIDTGSDSEPYRLVLRGDDTGEGYSIEMDFSDITDLGFNSTNYESIEYTSETDSVTDSDTSITFNINGEDYSMDVTAGTTVEDFISQLNSDENMQEAGVSATYNSDTNRIEFDIQAIGDISIDDGDLNTDINTETDFTNENRVQEAASASFTYNGVSITRDSNEIDDIVAGLTISLQDEGKSTITIERDDDSIVSAVESFVTSYNSLISSLDTLTDYDVDTGESGVFQSESTIKYIDRNINNDIFNSFIMSTTEKTDYNDNIYEEAITLTAASFGFSMSSGYVEFDEDAFAEILDSDPDKVEEFLEEMFGNVEDTLSNLVSGDNSTLELLNSKYETAQERLEENLEKAQDRIDVRYEIMAAKFASYDAIISGYDTMSSALEMQIKSYLSSD